MKASFSDLQRGLEPSLAPVSWGLATFRGRFAEVSGGEATAALTLTMGLVAEAQQCDEPTVWVTGRDSGFYPPDVAAVGIDLSALAVVWAQGALEAARAADLLLRSGAFGLVVLDLGADDDLPLAAQTRLAALAKKHETALLCLTRKGRERPSLGSLISLRADATRTGRAPPLFRCETLILKDKRQGPGRTHAELCHGPDGLS
ncbi:MULTISPECIES: recombinase A [unclassified Thiocapsa]|uniref:recombinase A n=1 Tax=unclassified Thiocapsa TaxID=2641286 RepID=UPI0035AFF0CF